MDHLGSSELQGYLWMDQMSPISATSWLLGRGELSLPFRNVVSTGDYRVSSFSSGIYTVFGFKTHILVPNKNSGSESF